MTFKKIQFKNSDAQKLYENYLTQIQTSTKRLSEEDQNDILMELNSHIFESVFKNLGEENELNILTDTLDKIGNPKVILKPLVAEKKLSQATKTFNPVHIFNALILNFSFGIIYFIFFILYLFLFTFPILIVAKILYPENVGCYYKEGELFAWGGYFSDQQIQANEILGNWFIPVQILVGIVFYFLITLLLKLKRVLVKKRASLL